jgi:hypothetical protein
MRRLPAWGVFALIAAVAALAGLAASSDDDGDRVVAPPAAEEPGSRLVSRNDLVVRVPPGWSTARRTRQLPGMSFSEPITLVNASSNVRVLIGRRRANSQTLLPAAFLRGLRNTLPAPERVRIGGQMLAYHYAGLSHERIASLLDVYVAPSTEGVVTAACLAEAVASLLDGCWRVVSRLSLASGRPLQPGRGAAFRDALAAKVTALDAVNATTRRELSRAQTPAQQARSVSGLAPAFRDAAMALAPLAPAGFQPAQEVLAALRQTGDAYEVFTRTLRRGDQSAYRRAKTVAQTRRERLKRLLAEFFSSES